MNCSLSSLDNGQAGDSNSSCSNGDGGSESIQDQITKLFEEIINLHDPDIRRKHESSWYGQLDNIITHVNSLTISSKKVTQSLKKRKRTEKEEKEIEKERPKSVASDFKWASNKPIRLNQSAQKRIEALNKQLELAVIDLSTYSEEKPKFKPVKPVMPRQQQPAVAISPMKDISNIIKTVANNSNTMEIDEDKFDDDDDDDEFLRNLDVSELISDATF